MERSSAGTMEIEIIAGGPDLALPAASA